MNVCPSGKQQKSRDTINNLPPKPGHPDTRGQPQKMVYSDNHPDPDLCGKAKGLCAVLMERMLVWDALCVAVGSNEKKVKNVCPTCKASQVEKDRLACVAATEHAEGEAAVDDGTSNVPESNSNLCCVTRALLQQQDFLAEKPLI